MLASVLFLSVPASGLSVSLWGTPFDSPRWPMQWDVIGDGSRLTLSVGHLVWTFAGIMLFFAVRRIGKDPCSSDRARFRIRGQESKADPAFAERQDSKRRRRQAIAAWIGAGLAAVTSLLAGFSYFVHLHLEWQTGWIKHNGTLDGLSGQAFLGSWATGILGMICCVFGLPRKAAWIGAIVLMLVFLCYVIIAPFRIYIP